MYVRAGLEQSGITPSRQRGQNFLIDDGVLAVILQAAELQPADMVLEIGPGLGTLTRSLAARCHSVHAWELDKRLLRYLHGWVLPETRNVVLHDGAFHKFALEKLAAEAAAAGRPLKIVTNLPYQISAAFLHSVVEHCTAIARTVVMLQREVAQRVCAHAGDTQFGSFSLYLQTFLDPRWVCEVPAACFLPPPRVDSAVLRLDPLAPGRQPQPRDRALYFRIIEESFRERRKQLGNALTRALPHLSAEQLHCVLEQAGVDPRLRPQNVDMAAWVRLSDCAAQLVAGS
jgi:16S rRNA (adenine1518-N6/adenine1519-N6)-dimethyltransferase